MKTVKILCGLVCFLVLASNVWSMSSDAHTTLPSSTLIRADSPVTNGMISASGYFHFMSLEDRWKKGVTGRMPV